MDDDVFGQFIKNDENLINEIEKKKDVKYLEISGICCICHEQISQLQDAASCPKCDAKIHKHCLTPWLNKYESCPKCLNPLSHLDQYISYQECPHCFSMIRTGIKYCPECGQELFSDINNFQNVPKLEKRILKTRKK